MTLYDLSNVHSVWVSEANTFEGISWLGCEFMLGTDMIAATVMAMVPEDAPVREDLVEIIAENGATVFVHRDFEGLQDSSIPDDIRVVLSLNPGAFRVVGKTWDGTGVVGVFSTRTLSEISGGKGLAEATRYANEVWKPAVTEGRGLDQVGAAMDYVLEGGKWFFMKDTATNISRAIAGALGHVDAFWIGGAGSFSEATHWSTSSGGANDRAKPAAGEAWTVDNGSDVASAAFQITMDEATAALGAVSINCSDAACTIAGNFLITSTSFIQSNGIVSDVDFSIGTGNCTITTTAGEVNVTRTGTGTDTFPTATTYVHDYVVNGSGITATFAAGSLSGIYTLTDGGVTQSGNMTVGGAATIAASKTHTCAANNLILAANATFTGGIAMPTNAANYIQFTGALAVITGGGTVTRGAGFFEFTADASSVANFNTGAKSLGNTKFSFTSVNKYVVLTNYLQIGNADDVTVTFNTDANNWVVYGQGITLSSTNAAPIINNYPARMLFVNNVDNTLYLYNNITLPELYMDFNSLNFFPMTSDRSMTFSGNQNWSGQVILGYETGRTLAVVGSTYTITKNADVGPLYVGTDATKLGTLSFTSGGITGATSVTVITGSTLDVGAGSVDIGSTITDAGTISVSTGTIEADDTITITGIFGSDNTNYVLHSYKTGAAGNVALQLDNGGTFYAPNATGSWITKGTLTLNTGGTFDNNSGKVDFQIGGYYQYIVGTLATKTFYDVDHTTGAVNIYFSTATTYAFHQIDQGAGLTTVGYFFHGANVVMTVTAGTTNTGRIIGGNTGSFSLSSTANATFTYAPSFSSITAQNTTWSIGFLTFTGACTTSDSANATITQTAAIICSAALTVAASDAWYPDTSSLEVNGALAVSGSLGGKSGTGSTAWTLKAKSTFGCGTASHIFNAPNASGLWEQTGNLVHSDVSTSTWNTNSGTYTAVGSHIVQSSNPSIAVMVFNSILIKSGVTLTARQGSGYSWSMAGIMTFEDTAALYFAGDVYNTIMVVCSHATPLSTLGTYTISGTGGDYNGFEFLNSATLPNNLDLNNAGIYMRWNSATVTLGTGTTTCAFVGVAASTTPTLAVGANSLVVTPEDSGTTGVSITALSILDAGSVNVTGDIRSGLGKAGSFGTANKNYTLACTGNFQIDNLSTFQAPNASGSFTLSGTSKTITNTGTWTHNSGTTTIAGSYTLASALTVNIMRVNSAKSLVCSTFVLTMEDTSASCLAVNGAMTASTGSIITAGTVTVAVTTGSITYTGAGVYTAAKNTIVNGSMTCLTATCQFGAAAYTTNWGLAVGVSGGFTGGSGAHTHSSFSTSGGPLTLTSATTTVTSYTGTNWWAGLGGTFSHGNGTIVSTCTAIAAVTIYVGSPGAALAFNNFTVSNTKLWYRDGYGPTLTCATLTVSASCEFNTFEDDGANARNLTTSGVTTINGILALNTSVANLGEIIVASTATASVTATTAAITNTGASTWGSAGFAGSWTPSGAASWNCTGLVTVNRGTYGAAVLWTAIYQAGITVNYNTSTTFICPTTWESRGNITLAASTILTHNSSTLTCTTNSFYISTAAAGNPYNITVNAAANTINIEDNALTVANALTVTAGTFSTLDSDAATSLGLTVTGEVAIAGDVQCNASVVDVDGNISGAGTMDAPTAAGSMHHAGDFSLASYSMTHNSGTWVANKTGTQVYSTTQNWNNFTAGASPTIVKYTANEEFVGDLTIPTTDKVWLECTAASITFTFTGATSAIVIADLNALYMTGGAMNEFTLTSSHVTHEVVLNGHNVDWRNDTGSWLLGKVDVTTDIDTALGTGAAGCLIYFIDDCTVDGVVIAAGDTLGCTTNNTEITGKSDKDIAITGQTNFNASGGNSILIAGYKSFQVLDSTTIQDIRNVTFTCHTDVGVAWNNAVDLSIGTGAMVEATNLVYGHGGVSSNSTGWQGSTGWLIVYDTGNSWTYIGVLNTSAATGFTASTWAIAEEVSIYYADFYGTATPTVVTLNEIGVVCYSITLTANTLTTNQFVISATGLDVDNGMMVGGTNGSALTATEDFAIGYLIVRASASLAVTSNTITVDSEDAGPGVAVDIDGAITTTTCSLIITTGADTNIDITATSGNIENLTYNAATWTCNLMDNAAIVGALTVTAGTFHQNNYTFAVTLDATVTSTWDQAGSATTTARSCTIGASASVLAGTLLTITGKDASNYAWNKHATGVFTHNDSIVEFSGENAIYIISGSTTWYYISILAPNFATEYQFLAGSTQTIDYLIHMNGESTSVLTLNSTIAGTYWYVAMGASAGQDLDALIVFYSEATTTELVASNSADGDPAGLNPDINWTFPASSIYVWTGLGADALASTGGNWAGGAPPGPMTPTSSAYFGAASHKNCTWDILSTAGNITMAHDYWNGTLGKITFANAVTWTSLTIQSGEVDAANFAFHLTTRFAIESVASQYHSVIYNCDPVCDAPVLISYKSRAGMTDSKTAPTGSILYETDESKIAHGGSPRRIGNTMHEWVAPHTFVPVYGYFFEDNFRLNYLPPSRVRRTAGLEGVVMAPATGLVATPGSGKIDLVWVAPVGSTVACTGYSIGRSLVAGGPYVIVGSVTGVKTLTYSDTDPTLVVGTTYYYVVYALY